MANRLDEDEFAQLVRLLNRSSHKQQVILLRSIIKRTALKTYIKECQLAALKNQTGL